MSYRIYPFIFLLLHFTGFAFSQEEKPFAVFSELTSTLRGNQSFNLSMNYRKGAFTYGLGADYYYKIRSFDRLLNEDKLSIGLNIRLGYHLGKENNAPFEAGLYLKYARFNIFQRERHYEQDIWPNTYRKHYYKVTPMAYMQFTPWQRTDVYTGIQLAVGFPFIFGVEYFFSYQDMFDNEDPDKAEAYVVREHGLHYILDGVQNTIALQANVLFGFRF